jgi:hypothetical protein
MTASSTPSVKVQIYAVRVGRWIQYKIYNNYEFTGAHYTESQYQRTVKRGQLAGATLFDIDGQSYKL